MKTNVFFSGMLGLVLTFGILLTGCNNGTTDDGGTVTSTIEITQNDFYDIWSSGVYQGLARTLNLSATSFRMDFSDGAYWVADSLVWTPIVNPRDDYKAEYPKGYTIAGTVTSSSYLSPGENVSFMFYMHTGKQSILPEPGAGYVIDEPPYYRQ
jgi:hypothetical protein